MKRIVIHAFSIALVALMVVSVTAQALPLILDYTGFAWGPSSLGRGLPNQFNGVGVVDGFSMPVNDPNEVYTYYLSGLTLSNVVTHSPTRHTYQYAGGNLALYESTGPSNRGFNYGTYPINGTVPSTFTDGLLWLSGSVNTFSVFYDDVLRLGSLSANGQFTSGAFAGFLQSENYFTFSGLTARPGNGIPKGYGYRLDGQVNSDVNPVPEPATLALFGLGLLGAGAMVRSRKREV
jgi:hypothetical protein